MSVIMSHAKENCVHPTIVFRLNIDYANHREAIITINGFLKTKAGIILGRIHEEFTANAMELSAQGSQKDRELFTPSTSKAEVLVSAELDQIALKEIDKERNLTTKKAVDLSLELNVRFIVSNLMVANYYEVDIGKTLLAQNIHRDLLNKNATLVLSAYNPDFTSNKLNGWILSGNYGPTFANVTTRKVETPCHISADDWIHEFLPKFGLGERVVFEVPLNSTSQSILGYLSKAEEAYGRWDTKSVYANCREIGTHLDDNIKNKFGVDSFVYKELWGRAYANFSHMASLDLHIEDIKKKYTGNDVSIGRLDAEQVINRTKTLIKYATELLER